MFLYLSLVSRVILRVKSAPFHPVIIIRKLAASNDITFIFLLLLALNLPYLFVLNKMDRTRGVSDVIRYRSSEVKFTS